MNKYQLGRLKGMYGVIQLSLTSELQLDQKVVYVSPKRIKAEAVLEFLSRTNLALLQALLEERAVQSGQSQLSLFVEEESSQVSIAV